MHNTVHFILQGKGGIGKTLVSTILAQWLAQKDERPLRCYDTDQENATFSRYKAMNVKHVPVMTDTRNIDPKRFDALMIDLLTAAQSQYSDARNIRAALVRSWKVEGIAAERTRQREQNSS